ncbi:MAG: nucleotide exchange factor GrpE [Raineya sp.]|jgi:molecular chaperone GrpE|nr:nucleotide exchange factor GrpE [Raineya sp.]
MENMNQDELKETKAGEETPQESQETKENTNPEEKKEEVKNQDNASASLEEKVRLLEKNLAEQKDSYLRLYADFENFRRRTAKEKIEFLEQANAKLLTDILPVFDDFERALKSFENPDLKIETAKEGITLIYQKFSKFLEKQSLIVMESNGQAFDPDKHEAIAQVPAPSEDLKGKVIDTVEKGYYLGEKVIRFAKVVTGN